MPARDIFHDHVKNALVKDGWTITHDPYRLVLGKRELYVDLGAEQLLAAEKTDCRIAVEIKSFVGRSSMADLENALGQFVLYHDILVKQEPDRTLFLAVREHVYDDLFEEPIGRLLIQNGRVRLIVFDADTEEILRWIP